MFPSLPPCLSLEVGNNSSSNAVRLWLPTLCWFLWRCQWANTQRETERPRWREKGKEKLVLCGEELLASFQNWMQSSVYFFSDIVRENREYVKWIIMRGTSCSVFTSVRHLWQNEKETNSDESKDVMSLLSISCHKSILGVLQSITFFFQYY